jgi:hypothetical protein
MEAPLKVLLIIVSAGTIIYLALKLCLYIYRLFFLSKIFKEINEMYSRLLAAVDNDVDTAIDDYRKWQSGDKVIKHMRTVEEITKSVDVAKEAKVREEEVHEKFLRLRQRFIGDPKKLSESIAVYQRYLGVKLKQRQDASLFANAVTSGAVGFDEMMAAAKETIVVLEENERRLDILLT